MIDTHLHLFDPTRHAFNSTAPYRPLPHECAGWAVLADVLEAHAVELGLLVAPTAGYDHDLRPLSDTLELAQGRLRGVARLRGDEAAATLEQLRQQGVVGVRLDLRHDGLDLVDRLHANAVPAQWAAHGWFVQVQADAAQWAKVAGSLAAWPVALLIDHCGLPDPAEGLSQPGFAAVCGLASRPNTLLKFSGAFRFSRQPWPHADTDPFAARLLRAFGPSRICWGSDWPFVRMPVRLDYGAVLGHLARWVPDERARNMILNEAPRALLARGAV